MSYWSKTRFKPKRAGCWSILLFLHIKITSFFIVFLVNTIQLDFSYLRLLLCRTELELKG